MLIAQGNTICRCRVCAVYKIECPLCLDRVTFDRIANIDWSNLKFDSRNSPPLSHTRTWILSAKIYQCIRLHVLGILWEEKSEKLLQIHVHHENEYQIAVKHQHMNLNYSTLAHSERIRLRLMPPYCCRALFCHTNQIYNSSIKNLAEALGQI